VINDNSKHNIDEDKEKEIKNIIRKISKERKQKDDRKRA
jgi:hypothetical protein